MAIDLVVTDDPASATNGGLSDGVAANAPSNRTEEDRNDSAPIEASRGPGPSAWISAGTQGVSVLATLTIVLSMVVVLTLDYGRDQGIYAVVARELLHGAMPYRDVFDFKPPGIFFLFALARLLAGDGHWGIRVLEVASMLGTVAGLMTLSRRFGSRRIGLLGGAFSCLLLARQDYWHTAQPESFGGTLIIWGVVCALRGKLGAPHGRLFRSWLTAGLLFGASGLLKPQLVMIGPVLLLLFAMRAWRDARPAVSVASLGLTLGVLFPIASTLLWFQQKGALADLHEVMFGFVSHYTRQSWFVPDFAREAARSVGSWLFLRSTPVGLGLLLLAIYRPEGEERPAVLALCAALGVTVSGVVVQAKFFAYHWDEVFPVIGLLAALGLTKAARAAIGRGARTAGAGVLALLVVAAAEPLLTPRDWDFEFVRKLTLRYDLARGLTDPQDTWDALSSSWTNPIYASQNRLAGLYLAARVKPAAPLFVWGMEPILYDISRLPLATRYIYDAPQRTAWAAAESRAVLMRELGMHSPAAIVVEHFDGMPAVLGHASDSAEMVASFPQLRDLLAERYHLDTTVGFLDIYVRTDARLSRSGDLLSRPPLLKPGSEMQ